CAAAAAPRRHRAAGVLGEQVDRDARAAEPRRARPGTGGDRAMVAPPQRGACYFLTGAWFDGGGAWFVCAGSEGFARGGGWLACGGAASAALERFAARARSSRWRR